MKTETLGTETIITAHTTVLGAVRAGLASDRNVFLVGRDGVAQYVVSFYRTDDQYTVYIATGPDLAGEDGDGTPECVSYKVSRDRPVVAQVRVSHSFTTPLGIARQVERLQRILGAKHVAGNCYPGQ